MSEEFRPGELVNITIRGARVMRREHANDDPAFFVVIPPNCADRTEIPLPRNGITVERVAPPEWPPFAGDLWRDAVGNLWFASMVGARHLEMCPAYRDHEGALDPQQLLRQGAPLALVHREPAEAGEDGEV